MDRRSGVLIIDKPQGISSAKVVSRVRAITGAKKVGHAGTLDPFATGVLVCCLNQATRISRFFLHGDKSYDATLRLGIETDTQDLTGAVIAQSDITGVTPEMVHAAAERFMGEQWQTPPVFSALKQDGVPLYKLARKGTPVQKPARRVTIHRLEVLSVALPEVRLSVDSSGGVYIRTLASDIGMALGCGAHLTALRRTRSGPFSLDRAVTLSALAETVMNAPESLLLIPMDAALGDLPAVVVDESLARKVANGAPLGPADIPKEAGATADGVLKVLEKGGRLLALLERKKGETRYNYCCVFNDSC